MRPRTGRTSKSADHRKKKKAVTMLTRPAWDDLRLVFKRNGWWWTANNISGNARVIHISPAAHEAITTDSNLSVLAIQKKHNEVKIATKSIRVKKLSSRVDWEYRLIIAVNWYVVVKRERRCRSS